MLLMILYIFLSFNICTLCSKNNNHEKPKSENQGLQEINASFIQWFKEFDCSNLLKYPAKKEANIPFIFGISIDSYSLKNIELLIKAFTKEFKNNSAIQLKAYGYTRHRRMLLHELIEENQLSNVFYSYQDNTKFNFDEFLKSIDCYVLVACGHGQGSLVKEAMSLAIPVIISNDSFNKNICNSGFVATLDIQDTKKINSEEKKHFYNASDMQLQNLSAPDTCNVNVEIEQISNMLIQVYTQYPKYLKMAIDGRSWILNMLNRYKNQGKDEL